MEATDLLERILNAITDRLSVDIQITINPPNGKPDDTLPIRLPLDPVNSVHDASESYELLVEYGVKEDAALDLSTRFPPARIRECLRNIDESTSVRNKPGFLIKALKSGYFKPDSKRQRKRNR